MKALSGVDAAFLHLETPQTPMHIASLSLFDLPEGYRRDFYAEVKRELARRLHLVPIFHRKLAPMPLQPPVTTATRPFSSCIRSPSRDHAPPRATGVTKPLYGWFSDAGSQRKWISSGSARPCTDLPSAR